MSTGEAPTEDRRRRAVGESTAETADADADTAARDADAWRAVLGDGERPVVPPKKTSPESTERIVPAPWPGRLPKRQDAGGAGASTSDAADPADREATDPAADAQAQSGPRARGVVPSRGVTPPRRGRPVPPQPGRLRPSTPRAAKPITPSRLGGPGSFFPSGPRLIPSSRTEDAKPVDAAPDHAAPDDAAPVDGTPGDAAPVDHAPVDTDSNRDRYGAALAAFAGASAASQAASAAAADAPEPSASPDATAAASDATVPVPIADQQEPAGQPADRPADETAGPPADETADEPAVEPAVEPADESSVEPAGVPIAAASAAPAVLTPFTPPPPTAPRPPSGPAAATGPSAARPQSGPRPLSRFRGAAAAGVTALRSRGSRGFIILAGVLVLSLATVGVIASQFQGDDEGAPSARVVVPRSAPGGDERAAYAHSSRIRCVGRHGSGRECGSR